jgi:hypothetical protein
MIPLLILNIAATLLCATAQNVTVLQQTLSANGVLAVYPTDKNFKTVSKACASCLLSKGRKEFHSFP